MIKVSVSNEIDVCIISPGLLETGTTRGGGCEVTDYNVALQLSKYFNVSIISTYTNKYEGTIRVNEHFTIEQVHFPALRNYPFKSKFEIASNHFLTFLYSFLVAIKILKLHKKNLKVIVVHNPQTAILSILLAKITKIKIIYAEGNLLPWIDPYILPTKTTLLSKIFHFYNLYFGLLACSLADKIRTQSQSIKEGMIRHGVNSNKIEVIAAGVETDLFFPSGALESCERTVMVGFIGRLTEIKGVNLLLEIVKKSVKELPNVRFLIFGEGPYKHNFMGLPNIEHLGAVPRNELNRYLSKLHIVLFFQKELGRAEIEAMSSGKVIIACKMGEMTEMIKHLESGILCEPNSREYIKAIKDLSVDSSLRRKISKKARQTVLASFTWDIIGTRWMSLCAELIEKKEFSKSI